MRDFRPGRGSGGNRGGGRFERRDFNQRGSGRGGYDRPQMFSATCDSCGKECEVPFRPTGERPVYCSECFESRGEGNSNRERRYDNRGDRGNSRGSSYSDKQMYSAVCDSCGKDCEVPFRPTGDRPVYCRDCFGNTDAGRGGRSGGGSSGCDCSESQALLKEMNSKLDKILRDLGTTKFVRVPSDGKSKDGKDKEGNVEKPVLEAEAESDPLEVMMKEIEVGTPDAGTSSPKKKEKKNTKEKAPKKGKKELPKKEKEKKKSSPAQKDLIIPEIAEVPDSTAVGEAGDEKAVMPPSDL